MNGYFYDIILKPFESLTMHKLREELLAHAHGKTLEIGIGTGLNLPYYPKDADVTAIEPDEKMRTVAQKRSQTFHAQVIPGDAQKLNFETESFDSVVATLVFCSIPDPEKALAEVYRVLRPGGTFLLLEHVRKNSSVVGSIQDKLTPVWKIIAHGCHLNRDPSLQIIAAGFKPFAVKTIWRGVGKVWFLRK